MRELFPFAGVTLGDVVGYGVGLLVEEIATVAELPRNDTCRLG